MKNETLKKAIELNEDLISLLEIEDKILIKGSKHWWGITDADSSPIRIPLCLREKIGIAIREQIVQTRLDIENL